MSRLNMNFKTETMSQSGLTSRTSRSAAIQKSKDREFFEMTVLSFQLRNQDICPNIMSVDRDKLFE